MKKIGLLVLAVILAMGSLGIAYARWSDTITISGTVNTGSVDINVIDYSGTDVYKMPDDSLLRVQWNTVRPDPPAGAILVSYAIAEPGDADDTVVVTFDNLFPCVDFTADVLMRYDGTIPVKVDIADITVNITKADGSPAVVPTDVEVTIVLVDAAGVEVPLCYQLHQDDTLYAQVTIHIPQTDEDANLDMMSASGTVTGTIEVQQWNEECITNGGPPVNPECAAAICATFTVCNAGGNCDNSGVCVSIAEGGGTCLYGPTPCNVLTSCTATSQCGAGEICGVNTCCGGGVCVPGPEPYDFFCYAAGESPAAAAQLPASPGGLTVGK